MLLPRVLFEGHFPLSLKLELVSLVSLPVSARMTDANLSKTAPVARPLIAAKERGPGPGRYALPSTLGWLLRSVFELTLVIRLKDARFHKENGAILLLRPKFVSCSRLCSRLSSLSFVRRQAIFFLLLLTFAELPNSSKSSNQNIFITPLPSFQEDR